ncbi:MAG: pantoate--beta-alanine ligase [Solirubrobacterales bacterium]|nr:pantoate--beta-alanine ligase [Solirubrobacterales bacterium]OJU93226.1 MAG: pantoate--beta-alanine ligase [Solirubrobacterales bacterium 67-14]
MKVLRDPSEMHTLRDALRGQDKTVGLVPTMGYLHEGHNSLLKAAREECDVVVMSLFVNPTQFRPGEDLSTYPRDEERDLAIAESSGVDYVYAPQPDGIYPAGFATKVEVEGLTEVLCGSETSRGPGHFAGVTTIVAKLLNAVDPDYAYFGQKDAQQATVIRRMAEDLEFRTEIVILPTVRERDGLAMSSRNAYLSPEARERATAIWSSLLETESVFAEDGLDAALEAGRRRLEQAGITPEYFEARYPGTLDPADGNGPDPILVAVAAKVDGTRLIDNILIEPKSLKRSDR